jgi:hypothetical protein
MVVSQKVDSTGVQTAVQTDILPFTIPSTLSTISSIIKSVGPTVYQSIDSTGPLRKLFTLRLDGDYLKFNVTNFKQRMANAMGIGEGDLFCSLFDSWRSN